MYKILLSIFSILLLFGCTSNHTVSAPVEQIPQAGSSDSVAISLSDVTETVKHYQFDAGGVTVKYFAVRGSDGVVRTAFDACEVCYRAKKGYTQVGTDVRCNNCGLSFSIDELGTANRGAGCWPAHLPNEVIGDKVLIKKSDLESGAYLFS